jgi:hypothetical protein
VEGNTLSLKYKDGEKTIIVPSDAPIVNLVPGSKADLKPGTKIFVPRWEKKADGSWEAAVVVVDHPTDVAQIAVRWPAEGDDVRWSLGRKRFRALPTLSDPRLRGSS